MSYPFKGIGVLYGNNYKNINKYIIDNSIKNFKIVNLCNGTFH